MKEKVYCGKCKYYQMKYRHLIQKGWFGKDKEIWKGFSLSHPVKTCTHKNSWISSHEKEEAYVWYPEEKNGNNDCPDYEEGEPIRIDYNEVYISRDPD